MTGSDIANSKTLAAVARWPNQNSVINRGIVDVVKAVRGSLPNNQPLSSHPVLQEIELHPIHKRAHFHPVRISHMNFNMTLIHAEASCK